MLVLGMLVLLMVLVVAFFTRVTTEVVGAKASASNLRSRQLAASAVQLVQGTITNATEPRETTTTAWACQPGMIRTFGTGTSASSAPYKYYKLYSSDTMVVTADTNPAVTNFSPSSDLDALWDKKPAYFTDLNAPIANATNPSDVIFPIADPRATDPSTPVEGFSYTAGVDGVVQVSSGTNTARLPMPVRWLYVLRDGTLTCPDIASASTTVPSATFTANIPTKNNPIVGRIAFWTDDESAKVNLNTASEGTYWDTPVANTGKSPDSFSYPQTTAIGDVLLATYQGAQHEYQRYPGHPATTCLSTVLGSALGGLSRNDLVQAITNAIPRVTDTAGQSSMGGTAAPNTANLTTDLDRLYASVDEFAFKPPASTDTTRTVQAVGSGSTVQNVIERTRFFLTSSSKAPELNLFGLPRVAMWPVWDDSHASNRTAFDNAILRSATVANSATAGNQHPMIFARKDPTSTTVDYTSATIGGVARNPQVYAYLQSLMNQSIPGFGTSFSSSTKYGNVNPFGAKDSEQILTEIFDYIRSSNLADNSSGAAPYTANPPSSGTGNVNQAALGQVVPIQITPSGSGGTTRGFGRFNTISELGLAIVKVDDRADLTKAESGNVAKSITIGGAGAGSLAGTTYDPSQQTLVEWALIPRFVSPMAGYVPMYNNMRIRYNSLNLTIGGSNATSTWSAVMPDLYRLGTITGTRDASGIGGPLDPLCFAETGSFNGGTACPKDSMYATGLALIPATGPVSISGKVTMTTYGLAGTAASPGTQLQQFTFNFPSIQAPVPTLWLDSSNNWYGAFRQNGATSIYSATASSGTGTVSYPAALASGTAPKGNYRCGAYANGGYFLYNTGNDSVRTVTATGPLDKQPLDGDTRLVALAPKIPASDPTQNTFEVTGTPTSTTYNTNTNCFRMGTGDNWASGYTSGSFVAGYTGGTSGSFGGFGPDIPPFNNYSAKAIPGLILSGGTSALAGTADWDNGEGLVADGPWINKPDEGMTPSSSSTVPYIGNYTVMQQYGAPMTTLFSPNRQLSSPVMFGSLPVGFNSPWQTLLFRPASLPGYHGTYTHPGNANPTLNPPDHLLLDLFWMPIVEPWSISGPLSTSGKINLNTQIAPFTYITRTTGMRAVLKSVMVTALNPSVNNFTKGYKTSGGVAAATTRYPIDADQTLNQLITNSTAFYPVFNRTSNSARLPNFFVSASQICDVPLIPLGSTSSTLSTFWTTNSLTGDNSVERPYSMIYPRVTTKSNTFTVHVRAQSVQQAVNGTPGVWREDRDQVTGEYRGAFTIEKYYDPNTANITDSQGNALANTEDANLSAHPDAAVRGTRWRLVYTKQFGQ